jgi:hypothetical protein
VKELPVPERIPDDAEEFACLVRHPDGRTILLINAAAYPDPFLWGMHAVDLLHHAARAFDETCDLRLLDEDGVEHKPSREEILQRMREGFDAEWADRTDEAKAFHDA